MAAPPRLTLPEVEAWLRNARTAELRAIAEGARQLVFDTLPDVLETSSRGGDNGIGFGAHQYGADGWGIAYLSISSKHVSLGFMHGNHLPDPGGILEGTGKNVRHVKLRSQAELEQRRPALVALLRASAGQ